MRSSVDPWPRTARPAHCRAACIAGGGLSCRPATRCGRPAIAPARRCSTSCRTASFAADGLPFADRPVLDAFAGTGAFGLEALSRGAAAAAFIENGREALAALRRNVRTLGEEDRAHIVAGDATRPPRARVRLCGGVSRPALWQRSRGVGSAGAGGGRMARARGAGCCRAGGCGGIGRRFPGSRRSTSASMVRPGSSFCGASLADEETGK